MNTDLYWKNRSLWCKLHEERFTLSNNICFSFGEITILDLDKHLIASDNRQYRLIVYRSYVYSTYNKNMSPVFYFFVNQVPYLLHSCSGKIDIDIFKKYFWNGRIIEEHQWKEKILQQNITTLIYE